MVIFHSYVSLPEAKTFETSQIIWLVVEPTPLKIMEFVNGKDHINILSQISDDTNERIYPIISPGDTNRRSARGYQPSSSQ